MRAHRRFVAVSISVSMARDKCSPVGRSEVGELVVTKAGEGVVGEKKGAGVVGLGGGATPSYTMISVCGGRGRVRESYAVQKNNTAW